MKTLKGFFEFWKINKTILRRFVCYYHLRLCWSFYERMCEHIYRTNLEFKGKILLKLFSSK